MMKKQPLRKIRISILILFLTAAVSVSAQPRRISVLYFDNNSGGEALSWLQKGIADMLLTDLALSEAITVIEREELEKIIAEQKFSLSGMADEGLSLEIGKLLSAELLITGSFLSSGGRLRIDGKILDTETGELRGAVKAEGEIDGIFGLETEIALMIFEKLAIAPPDALSRKNTTSFNAAESYYKGLMSFDRGEYDKAIEFYKEASLSDPEYSKPREGLEASYRFLKDFRRMRQQREINKLLSEAAILRRRLEREPWTTYADFIMQEYQSGNTDNEAINKRAEELGMFSGESPAVCAWNLQNKLLETADLALENFDDEELADYSYREIVSIAVNGRKLYAGDPFLPELIYQQLLVAYYNDEYEGSLILCEELMMNYPDYRMMWAVEDFYETALEELSSKE
jgi:TolB-like protein